MWADFHEEVDIGELGQHVLHTLVEENGAVEVANPVGLWGCGLELLACPDGGEHGNLGFS